MERYASARELFEAARQASYELWRHDVRYGAMEARALSLGGGGGSKVASGSIRDRMAGADAMADYEAMMERRVAEWCSTVDLACSVLYGADWDHGLARELGIGYAEVLDCIYVQRESIRSTAIRLHYSRRTVAYMRNRALGFVDAVGIAALVGR